MARKRQIRTRTRGKKDVAVGQRAAKLARVNDQIARYQGKLKKYEDKLAKAEAAKAELMKPPKLKRVGKDEDAEPVTRRRRAA